MKSTRKGRKRPSRARGGRRRPDALPADRALLLGAFTALEAIAATCSAVLVEVRAWRGVRSTRTPPPGRPPPKSGAQRAREHRARKKAAATGATSRVATGNVTSSPVTERNGEGVTKRDEVPLPDDPPTERPGVTKRNASGVTHRNVTNVTDGPPFSSSFPRENAKEPSVKTEAAEPLPSETRAARPIDRIAKFWRDQCIAQGRLSVFEYRDLARLYAGICGKSEDRTCRLIALYVATCARAQKTPTARELIRDAAKIAHQAPPSPSRPPLSTAERDELLELHDKLDRAAALGDLDTVATLTGRIRELSGEARQ